MTTLFEHVAARLQARTGFSPLEARGTVRLALRESGLEVKTVTPEEMSVVLARVMPGELRARGLSDVDATCAGLLKDLQGYRPDSNAPVHESPETVFERLGSR